MDWAVLAPTMAGTGFAALGVAWRLGRIEQVVKDICGDTDEIRDEIRELRAELHMTDWQGRQRPPGHR